MNIHDIAKLTGKTYEELGSAGGKASAAAKKALRAAEQRKIKKLNLFESVNMDPEEELARLIRTGKVKPGGRVPRIRTDDEKMAYSAGFVSECRRQGVEPVEVMEKSAFPINTALMAAMALSGLTAAGTKGVDAYKAYQEGDTNKMWKDIGWGLIGGLSGIGGMGYASRGLKTMPTLIKYLAKAKTMKPGYAKYIDNIVNSKWLTSNRLETFGAKPHWDNIFGKGLQYLAKGSGQTYGRVMDALGRVERKALEKLVEHPKTTDAVVKALEGFNKSPLVNNPITQWVEKHPMQAVGADILIHPAGVFALGPEDAVDMPKPSFFSRKPKPEFSYRYIAPLDRAEQMSNKLYGHAGGH